MLFAACDTLEGLTIIPLWIFSGGNMKKILIAVLVVVLLLSGATVVFLYKLGDKILEEVLVAEFIEDGDIPEGDFIPDDGLMDDYQDEEKQIDNNTPSENEDNKGKVDNNTGTVAIADENKSNVADKPGNSAKPIKQVGNTPKPGTVENGSKDVNEKPAGNENYDHTIGSPNDSKDKNDNNETGNTGGDSGNQVQTPEKNNDVPVKDKDTDEPKPTEKPSQAIDARKIEEIKDKVSFQDKMALSTIAVKRLSSTDISNLSKMSSNGLSDKELEYTKRLVKSKFSQDEVDKIKDIYKKYLK